MNQQINNRNKGIFTISLDFELMWGMIDHPHANLYKNSNVRNVPRVIDRLLRAFKSHGIHATFAAVGFIGYSNPEELIKDIPCSLPSYTNANLNPYANNFIGKIPKEDYKLFFAPDLIEKVKKTEGMEVGTHTFSHYYCWEEGQSPKEFEEDLAKSITSLKIFGVNCKSIIFPRNNVSPEYLQICKKHSVSIYRGNPSKLFENKKNRFSAVVQRLLRLADNYCNISGKLSYPLQEVSENGICNVKASRMLRPYSPALRLFDSLRLRRIKKEMTIAAKNGEIYHLWWHPHNFGADIDENFAFLDKILLHYDFLKEKYGMLSLNMGEIASLALKMNSHVK